MMQGRTIVVPYNGNTKNLLCHFITPSEIILSSGRGHQGFASPDFAHLWHEAILRIEDLQRIQFA